MCGRAFSRARKCLRCGDDLPWLVYNGEISFAARKNMSTQQYKEWRYNRVSEKEVAVKAEKAVNQLRDWLKIGT